MERINRPNDDFREILSRSHIEQICKRHGLPQPQEIIPESRGNEKVIYYLDHRFALAFGVTKGDIETLAVLERIEVIPTPLVIAWMEEDPDVQRSYMVTEQCPGTRLDDLWDKTTHKQRLQVLEALGAGMGRYHTVGAAEVKKVADELSLSHRVRYLSNQPWQEDECRARMVADGLGQLSACLSFFGLESSTVRKQLEAHYAQRLSQSWERFIGIDKPPSTLQEWRWIPETDLAECTNGKVFTDALGEFSDFREKLLTFYPEDICLNNIARRCMGAGQNGQYNFPRAVKREEYVTAHYVEAMFIEDAIALVFLFNRKYMPYFKWMHRALKNLPILGSTVYELLNELVIPLQHYSGESVYKKKRECIKAVCSYLIEELRAQHLSDSDSDSLMRHGEIVQSRIKNKEIRDLGAWAR